MITINSWTRVRTRWCCFERRHDLYHCLSATILRGG
jgi:hypothetical protein